MTPQGAETPRLLGPPFSAALAGAGFFFLAAAWAGLGPWAARFPALGARPSPPPARSAVRVCGGAGGRGALPGELEWLRARGVKLVVLEAWLDQAPPAADAEIDGRLKARFEKLRSARARRQALLALEAEEEAASAAPDPLVLAAKGLPVVLPYAARAGVEPDGLPAGLRRAAYSVTVRGEGEALPSWSVDRLPYPALSAAARGLGAVPQGRPRAVVACAGLWLDGLGLEAVRLSRGLPLDALRFHWIRGALDGLELAGLRLGLGPEGESALPEDLAVVPSRDLDALKRDPGADAFVRGKVVFLRPWPLDAAAAEDFENQARLYVALAEPAAAHPAPSAGLVAGLGAALLASALLLAFGPPALSLPLWAAPVVWALLALGPWPGLLFRMAASALGCLGCGLAGRLVLGARRRAALERRFRGRLSPGHWPAWAAALRSGEAALPAAYAALGPEALLRGAAFDAWMARWGLFLDAREASDGAGFVLAGLHAEERMARALLDLRHAIEGAGGSLARGTLVFRLESRLGFPEWRIEGPAKERAWRLFGPAHAGRFLLAQGDLASFGDGFEVRPAPGGELGAGPLVQVIGPRAGVWTGPAEGPGAGG